MAEGNGVMHEDISNIRVDDGGDGVRTEDYVKLLEYGLDRKVASKLDDIYKTGKLAHNELDERALDALKEFPVDGALNVLSQFLESNLEHVSNKSAYLCGVMKTYSIKFLETFRVLLYITFITNKNCLVCAKPTT
uniref:CSON005243 protein n=1 Tax=Culicoides sonorensis TaxID=179676 RepID=A0A336MQH5_CULSO